MSSSRIYLNCLIYRKFCTRPLAAGSSFKKVDNILALINETNQYEMLRDIVTPKWKLEYCEQLLKKKSWSRYIVATIKSKKIPKAVTHIHDIIPSPVTEAYRNKDEFSIRTGIDGNQKTVGFFIGSPAENEVVCVQPLGLQNLKPIHVEIAQLYQDFIRKSPLKACHDLHDGGFWKGILVRSNRKGELMVVIMAHPGGATRNQIEDCKNDLKQLFLSSSSNVVSLYFQESPNVRATNSMAPFQLLYGEQHIFESLGKLIFRISPDSFFQINTDAIPFLYDATLEMCDISNKTTLLDLCSGIGTLSLWASDRTRGCIGIECVEQAVEDAEFNALNNGITNCNFFKGHIEKRLFNLFDNLDSTVDLVAVVNPGRAGIHKKAIFAIRERHQLNRLVYISCKADSPNTLRNFIDLCNPRFSESPPFQLTDVQPVDMFPHTNHCELIMLFQR